MAQNLILIEPIAGADGTRVTAITPAGTRAAGHSLTTPRSAFRYGASGREDIGQLPGFPSSSLAYAISASGEVVGGTAFNDGQPPQAYRWSEAGGFQAISTPGPYTRAELKGLSADGGIGAGRVHDGPASQAFRWTETAGTQLLGFTRPSHFHSDGRGISGAGSMVVGVSFGFVESDAFKWSLDTGMQILPMLPGGENAGARGVNQAGTIVTGYCSGPGFSKGVLWNAGGVVDLGLGPGITAASPNAVNETGTVVVGSVVDASFRRHAGVWTQAMGMMKLTDYLTLHGVSMPPGFLPVECTGVSADGNTIVGYTGFIPGEPTMPVRGFIVTIPAPPAALILLGLLAPRRRRP